MYLLSWSNNGYSKKFIHWLFWPSQKAVISKLQASHCFIKVSYLYKSNDSFGDSLGGPRMMRHPEEKRVDLCTASGFSTVNSLMLSEGLYFHHLSMRWNQCFKFQLSFSLETRRVDLIFSSIRQEVFCTRFTPNSHGNPSHPSPRNNII